MLVRVISKEQIFLHIEPGVTGIFGGGKRGKKGVFLVVMVRGTLPVWLVWVQPGEGEQPKKLISDPTLCSPAEGAKFQL